MQPDEFWCGLRSAVEKWIPAGVKRGRLPLGSGVETVTGRRVCSVLIQELAGGDARLSQLMIALAVSLERP
jgi:hypothetical protein